jgi:hypothetical protein
MSAKAIIVDLDQQVTGRWYVHTKGARFEKFYINHTPIRAVLYEACRDPGFKSLGISAQNAVITEFDLFVNRISLEISEP